MPKSVSVAHNTTLGSAASTQLEISSTASASFAGRSPADRRPLCRPSPHRPCNDRPVPPEILLVLDTPSLYFRAFYGVPETVTAPDGSPVNAVRGFVDTVAF